MNDDDQAAVEPNASCPILKVSRGEDAASTLRSRSVLQSGRVWAKAQREDDDVAQAAYRGFIHNVFTFANGDTHRGRRKQLNTLVRPEAVDRIRDEIVAPQARTLLAKLATGPHPDGKYRLDLNVLGYRTFLHFTAQFIGFVGIDTDEQMQRLAGCVFPLSAAIASAFYKERAQIIEAAEEAKKRYVEEFYLPSRDAHRALLEDVRAGRVPADEVPPSFMQLVVSGAHEEWQDEEQAIRDSILLFGASVGSSAQAVVHAVHGLSKWFAKHPEDLAHRTDHDFLMCALQESVRLHSPFSPYVTRIAGHGAELGGDPIELGRVIRVYVPTASRDPELWGEDSHEFNPRRPVPEGWHRHGLGFSAGAHQCLGQRVVVGGDGTGGAHVRLLQALYEVGVAPDPDNPPTSVERIPGGDPEEVNVERWMSYPVVLDRLPSDVENPVPAGAAR